VGAMAEDSVGAMAEDSVAATAESAGVMPSPRPRVGTLAAVAPLAEAARFTAVADITAAEDIMAPVLDSVLAFTRRTDMPLRSAIPPDSMLQMACGNPIRVALCRTDIKLNRRPEREETVPAGSSGDSYHGRAARRLLRR
jgi:hypothetical protein